MDYITTDTELTSVANAIRTKGGTSGQLVYPNGFVNAIADISTGAELTSEDEGKVVIEDEGAYILTEQTSQTITQNGTYDTTTVNELIASVSGGGSANILSGRGVPSSSYGDDGSLYLRLGEISEVSSFGLKVESTACMTVAQTDNSLSFNYNYGENIGAQFYKEIDFTSVDSVGFSFYIGTRHYNRSTDRRFNPNVVVIPTSVGFNPANSFMSASNIETYGIWDGMSMADGISDTVTIDVSNITGQCYLIVSGYGCTVNFTDIVVSSGEDGIADVLLKVNGEWSPIKGQDIDDVDTDANLIEKTITSNGTYDPTDDDAEGYSFVTVNVPQSGGGSTNILSGTTAPTASDGESGDLFILYEQFPTLPNGGQHVEYLQSSGTQYIDTGVKPTGNHGFRCVTIRLSSAYIACGRNGDYQSNGLTVSGNTDITNGLHFDYGGNRYNITADSALVYEVVCDPVNGTGWMRPIDRPMRTRTFTFTKKEYTVNYSIILFGAKNNNGITKSTARIYRYTLYENGIAVKDYYPCLDGNGVACMWEDVVGEYVYNDGSGTFSYGNVIADTTISHVLLKVNGAWVPIEGQDIDDVDTGTGDGSIYYGKLESDYSFAEENGVICILDGRTYVKVTNSPAYVAYYYDGSFSGPILVSKVADGVQFNDGAGPQTAKGSIKYNGETWYYSSTYHFVSGNLTSTGGFAKKLEGNLSVIEAADSLLYLALNETLGVRFTSNGHYDVPNGYSGFGDIDVDVSPNLQDKSVVTNGLVIADNGYDGLNSVIVNVSGGSAGAYTHNEWDALTFRQKIVASPAIVGEVVDISAFGPIHEVIERHASGNANTLTIPFSADGSECHGFLYVWYNSDSAKANMQVTVGSTSYQQTERNEGTYGWHEGYFLIPLESVSGDLTVTLSEYVPAFGALLVVSETRFELEENSMFANNGTATHSVTAPLDCSGFVVYARGNDAGFRNMELTPSTSPADTLLDQNYQSSSNRYERDGVFVYGSTVAGENLSFVWSNTDGLAAASIICIGIK